VKLSYVKHAFLPLIRALSSSPIHSFISRGRPPLFHTIAMQGKGEARGSIATAKQRRISVLYQSYRVLNRGAYQSYRGSCTVTKQDSISVTTQTTYQSYNRTYISVNNRTTYQSRTGQLISQEQDNLSVKKRQRISLVRKAAYQSRKGHQSSTQAALSLFYSAGQ
jgi:hypothetical protein